MTLTQVTKRLAGFADTFSLGRQRHCARKPQARPRQVTKKKVLSLPLLVDLIELANGIASALVLIRLE